jgi:hypothetical protein
MTFTTSKWIVALSFAIVQLSASQGHAVNHPADGGEDRVVLAQASMDTMDGEMRMMRPDMAPPVGVMGAMSPKAGTLMLSLQYARMAMDGNRDGTDRVSTAQVLSQFPVAALSMDVDMLMGSAMYGVTDDITVMAMVPYVSKSMDHVTGMGVEFTTNSEGFGDVKLVGGYDISKSMNHKVKVTLGLSAPTGSTDERDNTPAGANQVLPYPMQLGSGTFDLLPGVTYTGREGDWSWGGQLGAVVRLGENDENYTLGNIYQASLWGARKWTDWMSSSLRVIGEIEEDIDGADPRLNPAMVQTADPDLRGARRVSLALGMNFLVPSGPLQGVAFSVEGVLPVFQHLDGPQVERDYAIIAGLRKAF